MQKNRVLVASFVCVLLSFTWYIRSMDVPEQSSTENNEYVLVSGAHAVSLEKQIIPSSIRSKADKQNRIALPTQISANGLALVKLLLEKLPDIQSLSDEKRKEVLDTFILQLPGIEQELFALFDVTEKWELDELKESLHRFIQKKYEITTSDDKIARIPYWIARQVPFIMRLIAFGSQQSSSDMAAAAAAGDQIVPQRVQLPHVDYPHSLVQSFFDLLVDFDTALKSNRNGRITDAMFNAMLRQKINQIPDINGQVIPLLELVTQWLNGDESKSFVLHAQEVLTRLLAEYAMKHIALIDDNEYMQFVQLPLQLQLILLSHITTPVNIVPALAILAQAHSNKQLKDNPPLLSLFNAAKESLSNAIDDNILTLLAWYPTFEQIVEHPALQFMHDDIRNAFNEEATLLEPGTRINSIDQLLVLNENTLLFRTLAGIYAYFMPSRSYRSINYEGSQAMAKIDDDTIALGIGFGAVRTLSLKGIERGRTPEAQKLIEDVFVNPVSILEYAGQNRLLACDENILKVVNIATEQVAATITLPREEGYIRSIAVAIDDKVITGTEQGAVRLVDIKTGKQQLLKAHIPQGIEERTAIVSVHYLAPHYIVAARANGSIYLFNRQGTLLKTIPTDFPISSLIQFSPEKVLAFGALVSEEKSKVSLIDVTNFGNPRFLKDIAISDVVTTLARYNTIYSLVGTENGALHLFSLAGAYSLPRLLQYYQQHYAQEIGRRIDAAIQEKKKIMPFNRVLDLLSEIKK